MGKILTLLLCLSLALSGCSAGERAPLSPDAPVSVHLWHCYKGSAKLAFDELIQRFNATEGARAGIVVNALGQGDASQLAEAVYDSACRRIGSVPLPHMFFTEPDSAYRVAQVTDLVDLRRYFSAEELEAYDPRFLDAFSLAGDSRVLALPVCESLRVFYLNRTDWEPFSADAGVSLEMLSTWEGVRSAAESYLRWRRGDSAHTVLAPCFAGFDNPYDFVRASAAQTGTSLYSSGADGPVFRFDPALAQRVWDNYCLPGLQGIYSKTNRYCHDDVRTCLTLAYAGAASDAGSFPAQVTASITNTHYIECTVLPYPKYAGGIPAVPVQELGVCVTPSDMAHEYACAAVLKWLTSTENAVEFSARTGYLPSARAALEPERLRQASQEAAPGTAIPQSVSVSLDMLQESTLVPTPALPGAWELSALFGRDMPHQIMEWSDAEGRGGDGPAAAAAELFRRWYSALDRAGKAIAEGTAHHSKASAGGEHG